MQALTREDLFSLEQYAEQRPDFRAKVMAHKQSRRVPIGAHAALYFEDRLTMQYQIQEMLRVERIFEPAGIQDELDAYNPLIPDGDNWKATFMIEFDDVDERRDALARLIGIEDAVWVQVGDGDKVYAIADEDLERENDDKTSSVHFLRFQLPAATVGAAKAGAPVRMGIDHAQYRYETVLDDAQRAALVADLD
ncbi:MAG: DUF3501 family protein [Thiohalocapsa sp.]|jgi:hypothetical protein|uniref:DUF3501 family protein n=1 Tax=Thiohalocapsa sp. TaxID=2497641 RepID=UPI0025E47252|nr:DUF3501 family protein [Thiohalocapsa sp.]MCG6942261.1 DUF3501 family protein [Thiohalocapsa sp.]